MWSDLMARNRLPGRFKNAALIALWAALCSASLVAAQQPPQREEAAPAAATATPPAGQAPVLAGKGPMRLPAPAAPAQPALPVSRPFTPSEQVRADADVAFPADI
ncbi:MAG: hypothetical protein COW59_07190 [Lysobacterales bacterium CG17_big_fil_post_rev_8_21_14_2_50_64_11]|nr:MAG: hypothetical protein COW59_07190 [Xanthomonadales bacterium CG17_big_fil_post_rev_8_21_14_2_50_64_11]PIX61625.1 MAG: hypothetical protein COZ47_01000 [Xanthomonadales bacterium CG_4_10_14_3_um_filter_64_11]